MNLSKPKLSVICAFCALLSLLFSSCSFGTSSVDGGVVIGDWGGASTDEGYFMLSTNEGRMMFYDYKTKHTVLLCNKPDCLHEDSDTCAAYVKTGEDNFSAQDFIAYGDYIYYFAPDSFSKINIIRTNLDNSDRITLASDNVSDISCLVAVNNKIYYVCTLNIFEDSNDISMNSVDNITSIHCFDLATNKVSVVVNSENDTQRTIFYEGANKDYIYFIDLRLGDETEIFIDETDGAEYELPVRSESKLKRLSLATLEETVVDDAMNVCFDVAHNNEACFVRKKGDTEFEVYALDYLTGELNKLFTTDTVVGYMASDENRFMYYRDPGKTFVISDCFVFDKRTKTSNPVHLSDANGEAVSFNYHAEHGDYFIGTVIYEDRQFRAMIKKDDFFNGKIEYEPIENKEF